MGTYSFIYSASFATCDSFVGQSMNTHVLPFKPCDKMCRDAILKHVQGTSSVYKAFADLQPQVQVRQKKKNVDVRLRVLPLLTLTACRSFISTSLSLVIVSVRYANSL